MKVTNTILVLVITLGLTDCNRNVREVAVANYKDSLTIYTDSFSKTRVPLPPLYDSAWIDSSTIVNFYKLAMETYGDIKVVAEAKNVTTAITEVLDNNVTNGTDILFLIDRTGSMSDDIENVQKGVNQIIDNLKSHKSIRVAIALYGDKNVDGPDWYSYKSFDDKLSDFKLFVDNISITGGGDYPESVYDGFFKANSENFWRSENKRIVLLIGDAPPLEKPNSDFSLPEMIAQAKRDKVQMNFYPIVVSPQTFETASRPPIDFKPRKLINTTFPNPAFQYINMKLTETANYNIELFTADGRLISSERFTGELWRKDVSKLPNGAYAIRAINTDTHNYESTQIVVYK